MIDSASQNRDAAPKERIGRPWRPPCSHQSPSHIAAGPVFIEPGDICGMLTP
jgi:hypothetical protein